jgi:hypothetical protein
LREKKWSALAEWILGQFQLQNLMGLERAARRVAQMKQTNQNNETNNDK